MACTARLASTDDAAVLDALLLSAQPLVFGARPPKLWLENCVLPLLLCRGSEVIGFAAFDDRLPFASTDLLFDAVTEQLDGATIVSVRRCRAARCRLRR